MLGMRSARRSAPRCGFPFSLCWGLSAFLLQILLLSALGEKLTGAWRPSQARLRLTFSELMLNKRIIPLTFRASNLHSIVLDEDNRRLYAAAKDYLLTCNLDDISSGVRKLYWPATPERIAECKMAGKDPDLDCGNFLRVLHFYNQTHLYVCGTGAFHPRCAYIATSMFNRAEQLVLHHEQTECGKGKCPYDPRQRVASAMIEGELYAGISSDFMSRDVAFFRSLGHRRVIRTEQYDSTWLQDPRFVKVNAIAESNNVEDDKVYLFFTERALEVDNGNGKVIYSRVARVCKNDIGGQRSLVNKWSTFLKARLVCSVPGSEGIQTHFDELQDVFVLNGKDKKNPLIYGVFTTSSNILNGSAVCVYKMADIIMAFKGEFAHKEGPDYKWVTYPGRVPFPRPGTCPSSTYGSFKSTREYPDEAIFFIRTHPLMHDSVYPVGKQPVLMQVGVDYKFTRIAVDRVEAVDGQYDVMFIGTDTGVVLKSIYAPKTNQEVEEIILEELEVFPDKSPITSLNLSRKRQWLYLGSKSGLAQVSLYQCDLYGKGCAECCLARDPYCTWNGSSCSTYLPSSRRRHTRQVTLNGDPLTQCFNQGGAMHTWTEEKAMFVVEGNSTYLECIPKSRLATVSWLVETDDLNGLLQEVTFGDQIISIEQGLLIRQTDRRDAGTYHCQIEDHGFRWTLLKLRLHVIPAEQMVNLHASLEQLAGPVKDRSLLGPGHSPQPWYKSIMTLINYPSKMDFYCEQVWQKDYKKKRNKLRLSKNHRSVEPSQRNKSPMRGRRNKNKPRAKFLRSPRST
ncbi:sema domain, immunoglobulin domain (Ig), short basic domain, secreted, (semaphorin) 3H isoform X1 [Chiloscyllium plagiosum]|uniref:sema domain, immunoglobulin domain (Ig), short basic domain, secreted, (semaphorin) 3H isoform X1 n=1 Tax=Chiloscyllium plagiosum TaxID=36176 RepID=UPI001CB84687|nr:sema domain, immunoglobulin domain (Ig), short basic domain, secreted, (semaphorin) 3H isoform X1 [Chiloscyllium plagiosum]